MEIDVTRHRVRSVKQVMQDFDVSRRTVENWFAAGLARIHLGRRVYTSLEAIQRFAKPGMKVESSEADKEADRILDAIGV